MARNETGAPDLSGLLSTLLADPGALSAVSSLLGNLRRPDPPPGACEEPGGDCPPPVSPSCPPLPCPAPCPAPRPAPSPADARRKLVEALRPFLSPEKCEMAETLLRILELTELVRRRR